MTDETHDGGMEHLEPTLRALAVADREAAVPAHVQAAVMHAWDVQQAGEAQKSAVRSARARARRLRTACVALASAAAACAVIVALYRGATEAPQRASWRAPLRRMDASAAPRGIVLVPDPFFDAGATSVVRVRMPRRALVSLGIPVVEPDGVGSVDLEVLVGEDGIARTIRRAVPAATSGFQESQERQR